MTTTTDYGDIYVCHDCYFAHHYGAARVERDATERESDDYRNGYASFPDIRETDDGLVIGEWFAGESDTPSDREPFGLWRQPGYEFADNTCSNHDGTDDTPCQHCGQDGYENGIDEFSWRSCSGCGSSLGGARYRLHVWGT